MSHPGMTPHNKAVVDERKLRADLVNIYGENSEHVEALDGILHRMWAAEDQVEEINGGGGLRATG